MLIISTTLDNPKHNGRDDNPLILEYLDRDHDLSTDSAYETDFKLMVPMLSKSALLTSFSILAARAESSWVSLPFIIAH